MNHHGVILDECLQRYCEVWTISRPEAKIGKFIKKWVAFYIIYLTEIPDPKIKEEEKLPINDRELAVLLHFFSLHGKCIYKT